MAERDAQTGHPLNRAAAGRSRGPTSRFRSRSAFTFRSSSRGISTGIVLQNFALVAHARMEAPSTDAMETGKSLEVPWGLAQHGVRDRVRQ